MKLPQQFHPKQTATPTNPVRIGVGWYSEDEWTKVKAAAADPDRFEATYAEWLQMAEKALADLRAAGVDAQRSFILADELLPWCLAQGKANDARSRAQFVSERA